MHRQRTDRTPPRWLGRGGTGSARDLMPPFAHTAPFVGDAGRFGNPTICAIRTMSVYRSICGKASICVNVAQWARRASFTQIPPLTSWATGICAPQVSHSRLRVQSLAAGLPRSNSRHNWVTQKPTEWAPCSNRTICESLSGRRSGRSPFWPTCATNPTLRKRNQFVEPRPGSEGMPALFGVRKWFYLCSSLARLRGGDICAKDDI